MLDPLFAWIHAYLLPSMAGFFFSYGENNMYQIILYAHIFVIISIVLFTLLGIQIDWSLDIINLGLFLCVSLLAFVVLKWDGLIYSLSCILQQWCLLLSFQTLSSVFDPWLAIIGTAVPFIYLHKLPHLNIFVKWAMLGTAVMLTYLFYLLVQEPVLNVVMHILVGTSATHLGIIMRYTKKHGPISSQIVKHLQDQN